MTIRRAARAEIDELSALAWASKKHWGYSDELMELWRAELTFTADLLERATVCVASDGVRIDGVYALAGAGAERELEHMWVRPGRIGSGLGRILLRHALSTGRAAGARRVMVTSDPHAEGFYVRMGARRIGDVASRPEGRRLPRLCLDLDR